MNDSVEGNDPQHASAMDFESVQSNEDEMECAVDAIGITEVEKMERQLKFSQTGVYNSMTETLSEPEKYLQGIPETRATFTPNSELSRIDPVGAGNGCCSGGKKNGCIIF